MKGPDLGIYLGINIAASTAYEGKELITPIRVSYFHPSSEFYFLFDFFQNFNKFVSWILSNFSGRGCFRKKLLAKCDVPVDASTIPG